MAAETPMVSEASGGMWPWNSVRACELTGDSEFLRGGTWKLDWDGVASVARSCQGENSSSPDIVVERPNR